MKHLPEHERLHAQWMVDPESKQEKELPSGLWLRAAVRRLDGERG
jgi:hypothetical protein